MIKHKFNITALCKFFVIPLCLLLLVCYVGRPITAQASAVGSIAMGVGGAVSGSVALPIAAVVLLVVAVGGAVINNWDSIYNTAVDWYESSSVVQNWADSVGTQIEEGTVIVIPPDVQRYLQKKANGNKVPENMPFLFVPPSFTSLDLLTQTDLLGGDASGLLAENNGLLSGIKSGLNTVKTAVMNVASGVAATLAPAFSTLTDAVRTSISNLQNKVSDFGFALWGEIGNVTTNIQNMSLSLQTNLGIISQNVRDFGLAVQTNYGMVIDNLCSGFNGVRTDLGHLFDSITNKITHSYDNFIAKIESILNPSTVVVPDFANPMQGSFDSENKLDSTKGEVMPYVPVIIGQAKDVLSKYTSAFLAFGAVLTKFYNIPLLGDLIVFSIGIGIFALVVNLANTLVAKESSSSAKSKKQYVVKGG